MYEEYKQFNMCLGEAYCEECRKKEYYNSSDPWTMPKKCKHCGGDMTNYQREKLFRDVQTELLRDYREKNRSKEDQFVIDLLESLKENFINDNEYYGSAVKLIINGYIKRME